MQQEGDAGDEEDSRVELMVEMVVPTRPISCTEAPMMTTGVCSEAGENPCWLALLERSLRHVKRSCLDGLLEEKVVAIMSFHYRTKRHHGLSP